jgi:hypothetical protein
LVASFIPQLDNSLMTPFALDDAPERPSRHRPGYAVGPGWFTVFSATFAGALLAGFLLLLAVRHYVHWSVQNWGEQFQKAIAAEMQKHNR